MSIQVRFFTGDSSEWDAFVTANAAGTFFHQYNWLQLVKEVYGGTPYYLAARREGELVGVLPLMQRWVIGAGRVMFSVPFADEGGICSEDLISARALWGGAETLARDNRSSYLELRQLTDLPEPDLLRDHSRAVLRMPLPDAADDLWSSLSSNMRKKVRRARRDGLATENCEKEEDLKDFYDVYSRNMRDLGSPMHSIRFFKSLYGRFPDATFTVLVKRDNAMVGAAVSVQFGDVMTVLCAHSLREYFELFPNNLLYWRLLELGTEQGCRVVDFGRSPRGSGIYRFKKSWGMEDHQLYQLILPLRSTPSLADPRESVAYRIFARVWRRTPMSIARAVGPRIFRLLPV